MKRKICTHQDLLQTKTSDRPRIIEHTIAVIRHRMIYLIIQCTYFILGIIETEYFLFGQIHHSIDVQYFKHTPQNLNYITVICIPK